MSWTKLTLLSPAEPHADALIEELCCELIEHGALGTAIEETGKVSCFIDPSPELTDSLSALARQRGFTVVATEDLPNQNWTQKCGDVWQPLVAGKLKVIPVESMADETPSSELDLKIIPGLGFGTGHHPTTKMILQTLSDLSESLTPRSIFDLGTGSGILAIAAAKLWNVQVLANDIDEHAISNARENAELNQTGQLITFNTVLTPEVQGSFDLIIANVYGEVLIQLASEVTRLAAPHATLILSGITELVRDGVVSAYTSPTPLASWSLVDEKSEGEWVALTLQKR